VPDRREVETLRTLARELRAQLDRQSVYQVIVRAAKELLGCDSCVIALQDPDRPTLVRAAQAGIPGPEELPLRYDTLTGRAFHENKTIVENDYSNTAKALPQMVQSGYRAGLATPLCDGARPIGVLVCGSMREGASFSDDDVERIAMLIAVAEIALKAADRSIEYVRRTARTEALQSVIQELSESYDLEDIAQRALNTTLVLFGADRGGVWLAHGADVIRFLAGRGLSHEFVRAVEAKYKRLPGARSIATQRPTLVRDVTELRFYPLREETEKEGIRAVLVVPLIFRGEVTGLLTLYHDIPWSYTDEDITLATSLAQQLAIAIANAQLHGETNRQLGRVSVLSEIGRAGVETLDLVARVERSSRALVRSGDVDACSVFLLDESHGAVVNVGRYPPEELPGLARLSLAEDSMTSRAVAGARIVTTEESDLPAISRKRLADAGFRHGCTVPMIHQGKVAGVMIVVRRQRAFAQGDIEFVRAAANQMAAAVEHARVFGQLAEAGARLAAVLRCAPEAILVYDTDARVVYHNAAMQRLYALEGRNLTGWTPADFEREVGPNFVDPEVAREIVRRVMQDKLSMYRMEYELARPVRRVVERMSAPVLGEQGQFLGQVVLFHDITQLREKAPRLRVVEKAERKP
jgi:PAS domain S-box-containing protein